MSRPKIGDKYVCLGMGVKYNGVEVEAGVVSEVIRDDKKESGGNFGVLWSPEIDEGWTFGPCFSDQIWGWRKLT